MEWKKILINRKMLGLILVLFLAQMIVFGTDCDKNDRRWQERTGQTYEAYLKEQELAHMDAYRAKIQAVMEQADAMNGISIFAAKDSFSKRNVTKTKEAFEPLLDLELTYVKGRTVTEFFSFRFGWLCAFLCGLAITLELSEIRKKKVRSITFPTEYGRLRLAFEKAGALFLWAFAVTVLFQIGIFLEGLVLFRENPVAVLSCPAQTFACLADFPLKITVGQALVLYLLYRTVILYAAMAAAWAVVLLFDHMVLAIGALGAFIAAEYFLYTRIDGNHVLKLLKYCNIWYQTAESDYFTKYQNLNVFEHAVNRNAAILTALTAVILIGMTAGILVCCRRYPCSSKVNRLHQAVNTLKTKLESFRGRILEKLPLAGMECYKVLVSQKGIVAILLLVLLLCYRADLTQIKRSTQMELYYAFMDQYMGEPGEDSDREIARLADKLEQVDLTFAQEYAVAEESDTRIVLSMWYESFEEERKFLRQIQEQTEYLKNKYQESGIHVWYVNLSGYNYLLQDDDAMLNLGLLIVMLWLCIGMYVGENGSGMACMINSCWREKALYRTKLRLAVLFASCIYAAVRLYEILSVEILYGIRGIGAPVQSVMALSDVRIPCTVWQYFLARYTGMYLLFLALCVCVCKALETMGCKKGLFNGIKNRKPV
ncbi:MAG: hypothetical protein NC409_06730 [Clostridium sp.]|nr:hypothetical protein [Clostridium sp.]